jgi:hypothetical protein
MDTTISINNTVIWTQADTEAGNTNNVFSDAGQISYQFGYGTGNGTGQVNEMFHDYAQLGSGATGNYNLASLSQQLGNYTLNKSFTKVKGVSIKNYSNVSGYDIDINVSSSSGFKEIFGYPTGSIRLEAKTAFERGSVFGGWAVSAGGPRQIQLVDRGSGATYEIAVWGITG